GAASDRPDGEMIVVPRTVDNARGELLPVRNIARFQDIRVNRPLLEAPVSDGGGVEGRKHGSEKEQSREAARYIRILGFHRFFSRVGPPGTPPMTCGRGGLFPCQ